MLCQYNFVTFYYIYIFFIFRHDRKEVIYREKNFYCEKTIAFISIKFLGRETFDKVYNRTNERSADLKQEEQRRKLYNGKVERSAVCPIIGFFSDFAPIYNKKERITVLSFSWLILKVLWRLDENTIKHENVWYSNMFRGKFSVRLEVETCFVLFSSLSTLLLYIGLRVLSIEI